jgi:hypothetical protein
LLPHVVAHLCQSFASTLKIKEKTCERFALNALWRFDKFFRVERSGRSRALQNRTYLVWARCPFLKILTHLRVVTQREHPFRNWFSIGVKLPIILLLNTADGI